jgi:hypothetical protein
MPQKQAGGRSSSGVGLLISNANTSFIAHSGEVSALSADILRFDQVLRLYVPEADPARETLRQFCFPSSRGISASTIS